MNFWRHGVRAHWDLLGIILMALAAVGVVALELPPLLRVAFTLPLVLFLPGFALVMALSLAAALPVVEVILVSLGASIAIVVLSGLLLGMSPIGFSPVSWVLILAGITCLGALVAAQRRYSGGPGAGKIKVPRLKRGDLALLSAAALSMIVIVVGTRVISTSAEAPPPAQLWLVPDDGPDVRLGARAGTPGGQYTIRVTSAGVLLSEYPLTLGPQQIWETTVSFPDETRQRPIVARLYEGDSTSEIRFVVLQPAADGATQ